MKKINKTKLSGILFIAFFVIMALVSLIGKLIRFKFNFSALSDCFAVFMICGVLSVIFYFSAVKNRPWKQEMITRIESNNIEESFEPKRWGIGIALLAVCCIFPCPLLILANNSISKIKSPNYVKTEAEVKYVQLEDNTVSLRYVYKDENGNLIVSNSSASFGGVTFVAGKKVTIYYNRDNPEILAEWSQPIIMYCAYAFFALGGLIAFCANIGCSNIIPLFFGLVFLIFSVGLIIGTMFAGGLNYWEVLTGGAMGYGLTIFAMLGTLCFIVGVVNAYNSLKSFCYKISHREKKLKPSKVENNITEKLNKVDKVNTKKLKKPKIRYHHRLNGQALVMLIVGLIFFLVGMLMFGIGIKSVAKSFRYKAASATVVEVKTYEKEGDLLGYIIYEYYVDGVRYEKESDFSQSAELLPNVGDKVKIKINKRDPNDAIYGNWINWIYVCVSIIPIGVGVGLLIFSGFSMRTKPKTI